MSMRKRFRSRENRLEESIKESKREYEESLRTEKVAEGETGSNLKLPEIRGKKAEVGKTR